MVTPFLFRFAYLSGKSAWTDLLRTLGIAATQPQSIRFHDHRDPLYPRVAPLLKAMNDTFAAIAAELDAVVESALAAHSGSVPAAAAAITATGPVAATPPGPAGAAVYLEELRDSTRMLALRAEFVQLLYAATAPKVAPAQRVATFGAARQLLTRAVSPLVARREQQYRVAASRVAGWRNNPTAYSFGYLWEVRSQGSHTLHLHPCTLLTLVVHFVHFV